MDSYPLERSSIPNDSLQRDPKPVRFIGRRDGRRIVILLSLASLLVIASAAEAQSDRTCSKTARLQARACAADVVDDSFEQQAVCLNTADPREAIACRRATKVAAREAREECNELLEARRDLCDVIGEAPYDPPFSRELFDNDFDDPSVTNRYIPLRIGNRWEFESEDEKGFIEVKNETKNIEGVTCITVNDFVIGEMVSEDTDDWFAQRLNGDIDYCGEEAKDFEIFPGDQPPLPELVEIDGSFKVGRDGAKSGTLFPGRPEVGQTYRQEYHIGDAEDYATVLSTNYSYGDNPRFDEFAPEELVRLLCDGDCVVTNDRSTLEPDADELKFYAPEIGNFLEVGLPEGDINQLVDCNFADVCDDLPDFEDDDEEEVDDE